MRSMTGFGSNESTNEIYKINIEIKSVNNRFKDIRFRMPNFLSFLELDLRKSIDSFFQRGSFDVNVSLKKLDNLKDDLLDHEKINKFLNDFCSNIEASPKIQIQPTGFLRQEFFKDNDLTESDKLELKKNIVESFNIACMALRTSREGEGAKIKIKLSEYLLNFENEQKKIKTHSGEFKTSVEKRLEEALIKIKEKTEVDEGRFHQEVVYYLEKLDINEELDRLDIHLKKLSSLFEESGAVGRQIDFLLQEINRETNTIGSKSSSSEISSCVVQMKTFLEKIREQSLNIE